MGIGVMASMGLVRESCRRPPIHHTPSNPACHAVNLPPVAMFSSLRRDGAGGRLPIRHRSSHLQSAAWP